MTKNTRKILGLTFLGLSVTPYTFSKMETCYQDFESKLSDNTLKVSRIGLRYRSYDFPPKYSSNLSSSVRYLFLYDENTGYSIGSYNLNKLDQCFDFFRGEKNVDPYNLRFFCLQEKSNLNMNKMASTYSENECLRVDRKSSGKLFIKDFCGYNIDKALLEEIKNRRAELRNQDLELTGQWTKFDSQWMALWRELNYLEKEFNYQEEETRSQRQKLTDQWTKFNNFMNRSREKLGTQYKELITRFQKLQAQEINPGLNNVIDVTFNETLISDAYITKGCMHLWNKYEPLWTDKVSSLPDDTFNDAIKITPLFSPQPNILIENKEDNVLINSIDFQDALFNYLDSDRDDVNLALFNSILEIKQNRAGKNTPYALGKLISDFEKGRGKQIELLGKSRILKVYAVIKDKNGKNSLVWGLAENKETKERFHWFTDLKTDISVLNH